MDQPHAEPAGTTGDQGRRTALALTEPDAHAQAPVRPGSTATPATTTALHALAEQRFVSLTTFRRSGTPVSTPVWVGWDDGALVVTTPRASGKIKRLRHQADVELRPCSRTGRVAAGDAPLRATAQILVDPAACTRLRRILRRKYRLEYLAVMSLERLGSPRGTDRVVLRITPAGPART